MKIYLKLQGPVYTPHDLLRELYTEKTDNNCARVGAKTFKNPKCTDIQCYEYKIRSFDDLSDIISTYFPKMELKDIVHEIVTFKVKIKDAIMSFYPSYCGDIRRITVYYYRAEPLHMGTIKMDSKYSWDTLFRMIGITDTLQLQKYVKENGKYKEEDIIIEKELVTEEV